MSGSASSTGTVYTFAPLVTSSPPFVFQPTLDGSTYTVSTTWNVYGQRWYANIYDLSGDLIVCRPLIPSQPGYPINIIEGAFTTSTMFYFDAVAQIVVSP